MCLLTADLSLQAAQQVVNSDPANALQLLTDISQNFPTVSRALIKTAVSSDLKKEIKRNQEVGKGHVLSPPPSSSLHGQPPSVF